MDYGNVGRLARLVIAGVGIAATTASGGVTFTASPSIGFSPSGFSFSLPSGSSTQVASFGGASGAGGRAGVQTVQGNQKSPARTNAPANKVAMPTPGKPSGMVRGLPGVKGGQKSAPDAVCVVKREVMQDDGTTTLEPVAPQLVPEKKAADEKAARKRNPFMLPEFEAKSAK